MNNTCNSIAIANASSSILALVSAGTVRQLELTIQAAARDLRRSMREARLAGTPKAPEACPHAARETVREALATLERLLQCVGAGTSLPQAPVPCEQINEPAPEAASPELPPALDPRDRDLLPVPLPATLPEIDRLYSKISAHPLKKNQTELRQQRARLLECLRKHRRQVLQSRPG